MSVSRINRDHGWHKRQVRRPNRAYQATRKLLLYLEPSKSSQNVSEQVIVAISSSGLRLEEVLCFGYDPTVVRDVRECIGDVHVSYSNHFREILDNESK